MSATRRKKKAHKSTDAIEKLLKRDLTTLELAIFIAGHLEGCKKTQRESKLGKERATP